MDTQIRIDPDFLFHHLIPLEQLDGIPAQIILADQALDGLFDMCQGVLHTAIENMGHIMVGMVSRQCHRLLSSLDAALALQRADFHTDTAQSLAQLLQIDGVTILTDQVDHIHGNDHRMTQFDQLSGQIQVAFNIGAIHNVQNRIRMLIDQISTGNQFLRRIRRQGVDTGQVLNNDIVISLQRTFLLLHRNTGPVTHILIRTGQNVEQCCLAAVGIAGKGNFNAHAKIPLFQN